MLPSDFIRPQYHLPELRGRQDLRDFRDFFCLHFEFPEEIKNTKSLREGGEGTVVSGRGTVVRGREGTEVRCRESGVREGQWTEIPGDECLRQG